MSIDEIFSALSAHMVEGMMYHDQMCRYYGFLGLYGYRKEHHEHFMSETEGYQRLNTYYSDHYNRLIPEQRSVDPKKIPENWWRYRKDEVDAGTKRLAIQQGVEGWIDWETNTKELYERSAKELFDLGDLAAYDFVMEYVKDVNDEMETAHRKRVSLQSTGYDMPYIMEQQKN